MCGIIGIIGPEQSEIQGMPHWAAYEVCRSLMTLQHRGQDAAGILSFDNNSSMFLQEKDLGLVSQVFDRQKIEKLTGNMAIGHTRYATAGTDDKRDVQPIVTGIPFGLGMVHNGNILNYHSLTKELKDKFQRQMLTANDLEVIINYFGYFLLENNCGIPNKDTFRFENIRKAAARLFDTIVGGYAVLGMIAGKGLIALRDPKGIRPLIIGVRETDGGGKAYCIASETIALTCLGYNYLRDVAPGEVVFIDTSGHMQSSIVRDEKEKAPCMFEWVYFSGAESSVDNQSVYTVRLKLGERLGLKTQKAIQAGEISPDVVMSVPDTSRPAGISAAAMLGLPYREGLIKNRYIARSFIMNSQEKRDAAVELKLSPILSEISGKNIFMIDDSIVRSTTSKKIVAMLKKYGAKEVVFGVTCPPIRYPCYYGIDFPDPSTLVANDKSVDDIAKWLDVKKVIYLDEEDLRLATGHSKLCMACVNNKYPTEITEGDHFSRERKKSRNCS
ncbi:MAG: amidophosphoribosyltransferase [Alphaproteobacteria bacterium]|nr:amidophosphoribosyltransferase [Alphaproteobacteria bacterium]MCK5555120.1 amidophosphoribosyltransferase [Alphaproteobacteria bacterium]